MKELDELWLPDHHARRARKLHDTHADKDLGTVDFVHHFLASMGCPWVPDLPAEWWMDRVERDAP